MNIIRLTEDTRLATPTAATIGFFDGVHQGHRHLIAAMKQSAAELGIATTVITFDRHPRQVVSTDYCPPLLTTIDEKLLLLAQTGIDNCVIVPFDERISKLTARQFMQLVLSDRLSVKSLVVGHDNRFGHNRTESFEDYQAYGSEIGIAVSRGEAYTIEGVAVSSSVVRAFLLEGETKMAERCLNYPYSFRGTVVEGEHVGTSLGFPTANIIPQDSDKLIPAPGVYGVRVRLEGTMQDLHGMMNIGSRPTFEGSRQTIEVHIFRFSGDLYGQSLTISMGQRLRTERKFKGAEDLAAQLNEDMLSVEEMFENETGETDFRALHAAQL